MIGKKSKSALKPFVLGLLLGAMATGYLAMKRDFDTRHCVQINYSDKSTPQTSSDQ